MLKAKVKVKWNGKQFKELFRQNASQLLEEFGTFGVKTLKSKVPVDTGNLQESQVMEEEIVVGRKRARNIGSDESPDTGAYYAPYVFYPGITRNYSGNDWISPTLTIMKNKAPSLIKKYSAKIAQEGQKIK